MWEIYLSVCVCVCVCKHSVHASLCPEGKEGSNSAFGSVVQSLGMLVYVADTECKQKKLKHYDFIHKISLKFLTTRETGGDYSCIIHILKQRTR